MRKGGRLRSNYLKRKTDQVSGRASNLVEQVQSLNDQVPFWKGEHAATQEELARFIQGQLPTFEHGKYSDVVREVFMDLITTMVVSSTKASEVVKVVLQNLGRSKVRRLSSQSFC